MFKLVTRRYICNNVLTYTNNVQFYFILLTFKIQKLHINNWGVGVALFFFRLEQNVYACPWSAIYFQQGDRVSQYNKPFKLLRGGRINKEG